MISSHKSIELEYYIKEGISPVHQDISNLNKHFQIRANLYRLLGLIPSFLKGKDIIEVAPGSGHNSIYTATLLPRIYDLVEPNPVALKDISEIFGNLSMKYTKPNIFPKCLEDFKSDKLYDVVICEGWLGGILDYEKSMLVKLSSFVKSGGVMLITFHSPIGGMATFLRRLLSYRLISHKDLMNKKTRILKKAFASHLNTLSSMSRSHEHWIQDCILNPHIYVGLLTPRLCNDILSDEFMIYQSVPQFFTDWRWYKSLYGEQRKLTKNFLTKYDTISHCMIDFRMDGVKRSIKKNEQLEKICFDFATIVKDNENLGYEAYIKNVEPLLSKIIDNIELDLSQDAKKALREVNTLLKKKSVKIDDVANMSDFSSFFGREHCYLSVMKE